MLQEPESLHFAGRDRLAEHVLPGGGRSGALVFGYLTDRLGRKKLFPVTLGLYLVAAFLTAFSWNFASFAVFRFLTGAAIGGEYSAINSAIDELIPGRVRGWADLAINGTFWLGARPPARSRASSCSIRRSSPSDLGWRLAFRPRAPLGLVIIALRRHVPESPRWLLTHGHPDEAERIVAEIEREIEERIPMEQLPGAEGLDHHPASGPVGFGELASVMIRNYLRRTVLGLALIISQAFLYNGLFFTFPLVLSKFYQVPRIEPGFISCRFPCNFLGPLLLGRLFDTVGRKPMIGRDLHDLRGLARRDRVPLSWPGS